MNEISLAVIDGRITTTSNQIAENFGKQHKDVLRKIERLDCSAEFRQRNFALAEYFDEQGKQRPAYRLTRDGFTFLAMGFTGKEAAHWKEQYIGAFNAMEAELLQSRAPAKPPRAAKRLPPPDPVSRNLRSRINRKAHAVALQQYDTIHDIITRAVESNLRCGASEEAAEGYVETYGELASGVTLVNSLDLTRLARLTANLLAGAGEVLESIHHLEQHMGEKLYLRRRDEPLLQGLPEGLVEQVLRLVKERQK